MGQLKSSDFSIPLVQSTGEASAMLRKLIWRVFFRQWKISLLLVLYVVVIYGIACFLAQLIDRFDTYKHGGEENFPRFASN